MRFALVKPLRSLEHHWHDQRGISGLETAIVLIAFVVVAAEFAFAALSTGVFTTDKAKETVHASLSETRGSVELKPESTEGMTLQQQNG